MDTQNKTQREIKFRTWDKSFNRMKVTGMGINNGVLDGEDVEIMQYTGLKDKNGKEIYEGDIVKFNYYRKPNILPVQWGVDGWWVTCPGWYKQLFDVSSKCEVVGNIYENKEVICH